MKGQGMVTRRELEDWMLQLRSVEALLLQAMLGVGDVDEARQRLERLDQAMVNKRTELLVEEAKGLGKVA